MILRDYQQRALQALRRSVTRGSRSVCLVAPTGSGKTVLGAAIAAGSVARGRPVLWLTHRQELVEQSAEALGRAGLSVSILRADDPRVDTTAPVTVASIPTLVARPACRPVASLLIVDEAHHVQASTWRGVVSDYPDAVVIGLTATPERFDGSPLGDLFEDLVVAATYSELVAAGHLVDCQVLAPPERQKALAMTPRQAWETHAADKLTVVFCSSVPEAQAVADSIPGAAVIHGATPDDERARILAGHAAGRIRVLVNCMVLTEGWDSPSTEACILARGCGHAGLYLQIVGRVLRPAPGKPKALLIDLCGSIHEHGHPLEDREYSLDSKAIRRSPGARSLWQCRGCGLVLTACPSSRLCPRCQTALPPPKEQKVQENGRLISVHWTCSECGHQHSVQPLACPMCGSATQRARRVEAEGTDERTEYLRRLEETARAKGYKPGWAHFRYKAKYGEWPRVA